jgi:hypothetical protein
VFEKRGGMDWSLDLTYRDLTEIAPQGSSLRWVSSENKVSWQSMRKMEVEVG